MSVMLDALTVPAEASAAELPWAKVTEAFALTSVPLPLFPSAALSPELLKALVAAKVLSDPWIDTDPEAGMIERFEMVSELSAITNGAAAAGRASSNAAVLTAVATCFAESIITILPVGKTQRPQDF
jgi:hypothetical protein